ncbi:hypothetical protein [Nostoc sp. UHCC 0252]|uniref:hypothetical protein n=1 Tax=Nostoc sp. UHCC 0252 TaxID=3110241 RepID=UPI002B20FFCF|nr:hypothetical protein [Nostoc sp. UHCC 0252]MEA5604958.1 hypothetical protein [Nostoc sp. UHCC 0252]
MKKHFFAFSLIPCAVSVIPTQALAVSLYGAGSLRDSLTEVAESLKVFQKINDPKPVIASEAKQSQGLGLLRFARNDN